MYLINNRATFSPYYLSLCSGKVKVSRPVPCKIMFIVAVTRKQQVADIEVIPFQESSFLVFFAEKYVKESKFRFFTKLQMG